MTAAAERYARPTPRRSRTWLTASAAIACGILLMVVLYSRFGSEPISAERVAFEEKPDNAMQITVDVTRDDSSKPAACIVRVRDISGAESGRKEVYVPPHDGPVRVNTTIRSIGRPVTADVFGCGFDVPAYLRPTE